jgi:hypothetical protein
MTSYVVTWTIDIDADSPEDAARKARDAQTREGTIATVFYADDGTTVTRVDLDDIAPPAERTAVVEVRSASEHQSDDDVHVYSGPPCPRCGVPTDDEGDTSATLTVCMNIECMMFSRYVEVER